MDWGFGVGISGDGVPGWWPPGGVSDVLNRTCQHHTRTSLPSGPLALGPLMFP